MIDIKKIINQYDTIVVGAGAGLSIAAGFEYGGNTFVKNFKYMYDTYGYKDMYSAGFHQFNSLESKWAYWAKMIYLNRYCDNGKTLYKKLFEVIKEKNYFVITTNVDHQFQKAGIAKERLFYMQGDYGLFQCSYPCHQVTYDNKEVIFKMLRNIKNNKILTEDIPYCPKCGRPMEMNLRCDENFVEDNGLQSAKRRYLTFLKENQNKKILFLELGVGYSTPVWIKYPFLEMTLNNPNAFYISIDKNNSYAPLEIKNRCLVIKDDISRYF